MTKNIYLFSLLIFSVLMMGLPLNTAAASGTEDKQVTYTASAKNMRDKRYCEVLYGNRSPLTLTVKVFNTMGLNDCPENAWQSITKKAIADSRKASFVLLNGPRYWMIDGLQAAGGTVNQERENFGGIEMNLRATVDIGLFAQLRQIFGSNFYHATPVTRTTKSIYQSGSPVFELISPAGEYYVMQSYAQIINPKLSMADLPMLDQQLQLPRGWVYRMRVLTEDLNLVANGTAYVIQDSLMNSYQRQ
jgi:hypothetical protein